MAKKQQSNVDVWLERETPRVRKSLESASRHFDGSDSLTVNTLEAVYGQESSFGTLLGTRGSAGAAGHFQLTPDTARQYGLSVSKENDQRFDIDYASSAAARYLKDLDSLFSKDTTIRKGSVTIGIRDSVEREKFVLGAYNGGQRHVADAQRLAEKAERDPHLWRDVEQFLKLLNITPDKVNEMRHYVEKVLSYQAEFALKSPAKKAVKQKVPRKETSRCTVGRWRTIDDRPVFICD